MLRDEPHFRSAHPDIALSRAGAAPAALQALEVQARGVPGNFVIVVIHKGYFTAKNAIREL